MFKRTAAGIGIGLAWGCAAQALVSLVTMRASIVNWHPSPLAIALIVAGGISGLFLARHQLVVAAGEWLVLVVLPIWGLLLNHGLSACDGCATVNRPLAEPEIIGPYLLHGAAVLAYAVARRRPERLHGRLEPLLTALLLAGALGDLIVAVHFLPMHAVFIMPSFAFLFPVVAMPLVAPLLSAFLMTRLVVVRLRERGREQRLVPVASLTAMLLGVHALVHTLIYGEAFAVARAFTRACAGLLAQEHPVQTDCHYLCTVAARGHSWLVRPERIGRRRGVPILVNRQLAIANAFEDLLHERWPRFGRLARRIYDRLGLPVSRLIRGRLLADLVYLAMKPAEWLFYLVLLLLDRRSPEERLARMYRA